MIPLDSPIRVHHRLYCCCCLNVPGWLPGRWETVACLYSLHFFCVFTACVVRAAAYARTTLYTPAMGITFYRDRFFFPALFTILQWSSVSCAPPAFSAPFTSRAVTKFFPRSPLSLLATAVTWFRHITELFTRFCKEPLFYYCSRFHAFVSTNLYFFCTFLLCVPPPVNTCTAMR